MSEIILLLLSLFVFIMAGFSLITIFFDRDKKFQFLEKFALSYGFGLGIVSFQMLCYYFLKIKLGLLYLVLPWLPVAFLSSCFLKKETPTESAIRPQLTLFEKLIFVGISLEMFLAFFRAFLKPLESFDSIAIYAIRSKIIYLDGQIAPNFFSEITKNYPNPDHPLLIPLAEVWVYTFLGNLNELLVKIIFPVFFLSFLVIFFFLLKRFVTKKCALLFTFLLASIPQFNRFATIGYTDFALAYYYSIAAIYLFVWIKQADKRFLFLSAVFSGFMILTKNEGLVLFLVNFIIVSLFLISSSIRFKLRHAVIFVLIVILVAGPWLAIRAFESLDNEVFNFNSMSLNRLSDIVGKLRWVPIIIYEFQKQFFGPKKWNILWIVFIFLLITDFKQAFKGVLKYVSLSIILAMVFYGGAYLLIPTQTPINWYLGSTLSRLFIHFAPICVFWIALICHNKKLIPELEHS